MTEFEVEFDAPEPEPPTPSPKPEARIVTKAQRRREVEEVALVHNQDTHRNGHHGPNGKGIRDLPHSIEDEEALLSCCMIDVGAAHQCRSANITDRSLYHKAHKIVLNAIYHLLSANEPVEAATVASRLQSTREIDSIGGIPYITQVSKAVPTTAKVGFFIDRVRDLASKRSIILEATKLIERVHNGEEVFELPAWAQEIIPDTPTLHQKPRGLFEFNLPRDGDTSILLGDRYLNRGDAAVIVSTSGMGKSTIAIQMATELALNRGPFGIQGNGPLRSLIVQSEDSEGDVAEVAFSIRHVLGLNDAQVRSVNEVVKVVTDRVNRGDRFVSSLRKLIADFKPDLVFINPLQAFMDGDVTDSKDLGKFLREGLNRLNEPASFGYVIIHHTTKPATGKERSDRLWHEVMYDMAGGAEIINWARAIISLRATETEGNFNLVLAKRGRRAGVTKKVPQGVGYVLEPVTSIPLKHAKGRLDVPGIKRGLPVIFWDGREQDVATTSDSDKGGRPSKHDFEDYRNIFPVASSPGLELSPLNRIMDTNRKIAKQSLYSALQRWSEMGLIEIIRPAGSPIRYRARA